MSVKSGGNGSAAQLSRAGSGASKPGCLAQKASATEADDNGSLNSDEGDELLSPAKSHGGSEDGGSALVGSISHILKTLFRDLYLKPAQPPGTEEEEKEEPEPAPAPGSRAGSRPGSRPGSAAPSAGGEGGEGGEDGEGGGEGGEGEGEGEGEAAEEEDEDPEAAEARRQAEAEAAAAAAEAAAAAAAEAEAAARVAAAAEAERRAEAEAVRKPKLSAHQKRAAVLMSRVDERLAVQKAEATRTLAMLEEARRRAEAADHEEENFLKAQGILVNRHVPVGPSHLSRTLGEARASMDADALRALEEADRLRMEETEGGGGGGNNNGPPSPSGSVSSVEKRSRGRAGLADDESTVTSSSASTAGNHTFVDPALYPSLVPDLIDARSLMEENWRDFLYKSGNLPKPVIAKASRRSDADSDDGLGGGDGQAAAAAGLDDGLGYLKMTGSLENRKSMILSVSHGPHGAKHKRASSGYGQKGGARHGGPGSSDAALDSMLRSAIDDGLEAKTTGGNAAQHGGSATGTGTGAEKKNKKKKDAGPAHGEQHDVDMKVLQRMDKKLKFRGNPRFDPANLNHHRLLTLPPQGPAIPEDPEAEAKGNGGGGGGGHGATQQFAATTTGLLGPTDLPPDGTAGVLAAWAGRSKRAPPGDHGYFVVAPDVVEFTSYDVAGEYESSVHIRNVTAVARSLQILPLTSQFFSVSDVAYPNKDVGSLAPGMSVRVTVKFEPDSLADYDDFLTVRSEAGDFPVRVWAHRPPPVLSIPALLDIGACLVGDAKSVTFTCRNDGGPGKFRLLSPDDYPEPSTAQRNLFSLRMEPFNITPTEFSLEAGEEVNLCVDYVPLELGSHSAAFVMVCDNCQVAVYEVAGTSENVQLRVAEANGGALELDTTLRQLLFEPLALGAVSRQSVALANSTSLDLRFRWDFRPDEARVVVGAHPPLVLSDEQKAASRAAMSAKPSGAGCKAVGGSGGGGGGGGSGGTVVDAAGGMHEAFQGFNVSPRFGVVKARSTQAFAFGFSPDAPSPVGCQAVLVVEGVPPPSVPSADQATQLGHLHNYGHGRMLRLQSWFRSICPPHAPGEQPEAGPAELKQGLEELGLMGHKRAIRDLIERMDADGDGLVDLGEFMAACPDSLANTIEERMPRVPFADIQKAIRCDVDTLSLRLKGAGQHVLVGLDPPTLVAPGEVACTTSWRRTVHVENLSNCAASFRFGAPLVDCEDSVGAPFDFPFEGLDTDRSCRVTVEPASGNLGPRGSPSGRLAVTVTVTPLVAGRFDFCVPCVAAGGLNSAVRVVATGAGAGRHGPPLGIPLRVGLVASGPRLAFNQAEVDLGLMAVLGNGGSPVTFSNVGTVPLIWSLAPTTRAPGPVAAKALARTASRAASRAGKRKSPHGGPGGGNDEDDPPAAVLGRDGRPAHLTARLHCEPSHGMLQPGESALACVVCSAGSSAERVRATLECGVSRLPLLADDDSAGADDALVDLLRAGLHRYEGPAFSSQFISVRGEVQAPKVYLDVSELAVGTCYVGVPIMRTLTLRNLSNLATNFSWGRCLGDAPTGYAFSFSPAAGTIGEKANLKVAFTFTPKSPGVLSELFACECFGIPDPIGFELKAAVRGVVVSFEALAPGAVPPKPLGKPSDPQFTGAGQVPTARKPPKFNFGDNVPLFERRTLQFAIRNFSAIACPFTLNPTRYRVAVGAGHQSWAPGKGRGSGGGGGGGGGGDDDDDWGDEKDGDEGHSGGAPFGSRGSQRPGSRSSAAAAAAATTMMTTGGTKRTATRVTAAALPSAVAGASGRGRGPRRRRRARASDGAASGRGPGASFRRSGCLTTPTSRRVRTPRREAGRTCWRASRRPRTT